MERSDGLSLLTTKPPESGTGIPICSYSNSIPNEQRCTALTGKQTRRPNWKTRQTGCGKRSSKAGRFCDCSRLLFRKLIRTIEHHIQTLANQPGCPLQVLACVGGRNKAHLIAGGTEIDAAFQTFQVEYFELFNT